MTDKTETTAEGWRRWLHASNRHWLLFLSVGAIAVVLFGQIVQTLDPWLPGSRLMASYTVRGVLLVGVFVWLGRVQKARRLNSDGEVS